VQLTGAAVDLLLILPDHWIEVLVAQRVLEDEEAVGVEAVDLLGRKRHGRVSFGAAALSRGNFATYATYATIAGGGLTGQFGSTILPYGVLPGHQTSGFCNF